MLARGPSRWAARRLRAPRRGSESDEQLRRTGRVEAVVEAQLAAHQQLLQERLHAGVLLAPCASMAARAASPGEEVAPVEEGDRPDWPAPAGLVPARRRSRASRSLEEGPQRLQRRACARRGRRPPAAPSGRWRTRPAPARRSRRRPSGEAGCELSRRGRVSACRLRQLGSQVLRPELPQLGAQRVRAQLRLGDALHGHDAGGVHGESGTPSAFAAPRRCPGMMNGGSRSDTTAAARLPSSASRGTCSRPFARAAPASRGRPARRSAVAQLLQPSSAKAWSRSDACGVVRTERLVADDGQAEVLPSAMAASSAWFSARAGSPCTSRGRTRPATAGARP